ncbi:hypothetical protein ACFQY7_06940 [Actinomadura luteofluorescens]|uniref:hypothetical protein n=1 Tax=Actinomadura luteofluorescens TaxID=46163 RepID=UPI003624B6A1
MTVAAGPSGEQRLTAYVVPGTTPRTACRTPRSWRRSSRSGCRPGWCRRRSYRSPPCRRPGTGNRTLPLCRRRKRTPRRRPCPWRRRPP